MHTVRRKLDNNAPASAQAAPFEDLVERRQPQVVPETPVQSPEPALTGMEKDRRTGAYMTHELRAPLTSIRSALGILEMQLAGKLEDSERQMLKMAVRNADRLDGLIDDIMDFSKIRAGKMEVRLEALQPEELISEAIDSLRSWAVAKGIRLVRVDMDEPMPRVLADRRRVVQILTNLLSNAIKFSPQGSKIEASAVLGRFEHTGTVTFRVKDQGPGIPHADLEKIFRTFEQSALGAKSGQGTGLGLTLARAMVELQGGRIWAESWKGLGATLLFTMPLFTGDATRPATPYPKEIRYHGLLLNLFRRLNAVVAAMF